MSTAKSSNESEFLHRARRAFDNLFESAQEKDELNFALSLAAEFKPYRFTSAMEAQVAYREYEEFLELAQFAGKGIRVRVALNFYCYVAEAAGLWCIPMCMLGVIAGEKYNVDPFRPLVRQQSSTGKNVAPNTNKVMGALTSRAEELGLNDVADVFRNAYDADLRNGVAHSDYVLESDGIYVRGRHDMARKISWPELQQLFNDGVGLYHVLRDTVNQYQSQYESPKVVRGTMNDRDPPCYHVIYFDRDKRTMTVMGSHGVTPEKLLEMHRESLLK
jgi:hypothetical protein